MDDWFSDLDDILGVAESTNREIRTKARNKKEPIPLSDDPEAPRFVTRKRRVFHDASRASNARKTLLALPAPEESHHYLMRGEYDAFDLVEVLLELAGPAESLHLATLGFNAANATRLIGMHDAGAVARPHMLVSAYYAADPKEADTCYKLSTELPKRGGWYCVARNHCKIVAARTAAGDFVIESSANLRSCKTLEQFTLTQDRGLYEFHTGWMERVNREVSERRKEKEAA